MGWSDQNKKLPENYRSSSSIMVKPGRFTAVEAARTTKRPQIPVDII